MPKLTHYVEARALPLDGSQPSRGDLAFVVSKIMAAVHNHIVDGNAIAVGFPQYSEDNSDGKSPVGVGTVIRIFGTAKNLMGLLVRQEFAHLIAGAACSLGKEPIRVVPEAASTVVYRRSRAVEKDTEAFFERSVRRRDRSVANGMELGAVMRRTKKPCKRLPPYINMESGSTGQRFRLFIERDTNAASQAADPSTYGLGVNVPSF